MFMPRMMQFCGTLLADWLTSTVHGDVIAVSVEMLANPSTDKDTTVYFDDLDQVNLKSGRFEKSVMILFPATLCDDSDCFLL